VGTEGTLHNYTVDSALDASQPRVSFSLSARRAEPDVMGRVHPRTGGVLVYDKCTAALPRRIRSSPARVAVDDRESNQWSLAPASGLKITGDGRAEFSQVVTNATADLAFTRTVIIDPDAAAPAL
jgi:hypothetical protein